VFPHETRHGAQMVTDQHCARVLERAKTCTTLRNYPSLCHSSSSPHHHGCPARATTEKGTRDRRVAKHDLICGDLLLWTACRPLRWPKCSPAVAHLPDVPVSAKRNQQPTPNYQQTAQKPSSTTSIYSSGSPRLKGYQRIKSD
jgi:hypothetical protein